MVVLHRAGVLVALALMVAPPVDASAQVPEPSSAQSPPAPTATQETPGQTPPSQPAPRTRRPGRTTRAPRTSPRRPPPGGAGARDEARSSRVAEPVRQELMLTTNMLWGYDDNLTGGTGTGSVASPDAMASGSTASFDAALGYFHGNRARSIRVAATGNLLAYPGYLDHPAAGGTATIDVKTMVGRKMTVGASERVGYEPFFNVFSQGATSAPLPPGIDTAVPATGLYERRSVSSRTSVSLEQRWTRRDTSSMAYAYRVQQFTDEDHGDNRAHEVLAAHRRRFGRGARARASYRYVDRESTDFDGATRPTREHRIEGGPEFDFALSRRRRLALSLGAGASYIESVSSVDRERVSTWLPAGNARAVLDLTSSWALEGGYERDFSLLRGLTDEVYATDTAFLTTRGRVTSRLDMRLGATYSNWQTPFSSGVDGRMEVYGASLQMGVALTRTVSAAGGYYYYRHAYSNPGELPLGFPSEYDRHAVRVGLTVAVPLMGTPTPLAPR